jgi:protease IV
MKRLLKWISIILGIFLVFIFISYFVISSILDTEPIVYDNSYLYISLAGQIPEYIPYAGFEDLFESGELDMHSIRKSLKMAAVDARIKAVVLRISPLLVGYAKIQDIQQSIELFKQSGKKVYAYFDLATTKDYYLATACDSIYLTPEGMFLLTGVRAELTFYKDLLKEHIGIEADFEHIGKYKNAPDSYTRQNMSNEQREIINSIVDYRYNEIVSTISKQRGISSQKIKQIINDISGLTPDEALDLNLIDGLKYFEDVIDLVSINGRVHKVTAAEYSRIPPSSLDLEQGPKVAVIYSSGTITGGNDSDDPIIGQTIGSARLVRNLRSAADSKSTKAIVLRINSPGGSGIASDNILNAINYAREKKPVIASISDLGASGGYYIAIGADTIVSQSGSLVGSIGVFAGKFSLEKLYKKWGINTETIQRGKNANLFSLNQKFSKTERKVIQKIIGDFYKNFVQKVSDNRNKTFDEIHNIAQGRVWNGYDGYQIGLIDTLGGLNTAIEIAKSMAGISEDSDPKIVVYPRKKSVLSKLIKNLTLVKNSKEYFIINNVKKFMSEFELRPLALMPFELTIN